MVFGVGFSILSSFALANFGWNLVGEAAPVAFYWFARFFLRFSSWNCSSSRCHITREKYVIEVFEDVVVDNSLFGPPLKGF